MAEDAELASRICRGEIAAFEALYEKYRRKLYRTALAITGDRSASEEILQDAFVRAYAAMDRVHCSDSLSPWLHRITVNLTYNWARSRRWSLSLDAFQVPTAPRAKGSAAQTERGSETRSGGGSCCILREKGNASTHCHPRRLSRNCSARACAVALPRRIHPTICGRGLRPESIR